MLTFVIPVRHQRSVPDWSLVKEYLSATATSISAQTNPNWEARVVANEGADLPELSDRFRIVRVDFDFEPLPDPGIDQERYYEAVRLDKGRRILAGLTAAPLLGHVMVVDYDDLVSRRLAALCETRPLSPGWYVDAGFIFSGGHLLVRYARAFWDFCGTSHIVRADLLLPPDASNHTDAYIRRTLGSHKFIRGDLAAMGTPLEPLPFEGAVYRIGHSGTTSGSKALRAFVTEHWSLRHPLYCIRTLSSLRYLTGSLKREFLGSH